MTGPVLTRNTYHLVLELNYDTFSYLKSNFPNFLNIRYYNNHLMTFLRQYSVKMNIP